MNIGNYWLYCGNQVVATIEAERNLSDHEVRMLVRAKHLETPFGWPHEVPHQRERKIIAADVRLAT